MTGAVYGNGTTYSYTYDNYHRVTGVNINSAPAFTYEYNANGALAQQYDVASSRTTEYTYDISGRLVRILQPGYSDLFTTYDTMNRVTGIS